MNRDLSQVITQLDGEEFKDDKGTLTLQKVLFLATTTPTNKDDGSSIDEKMKLYALALRITSNIMLDVTAEEIALLKERINLVFKHVVIVGRALEMLEPK